MSAKEKRYYWLKLKEDFFIQPQIKKLRKIAGGDTYTVIFLKLQLMSLKTDGVIEFTGIEDDFAEELALNMDEDTENVKFVLMYLQKVGWLVEHSENIYSLPETIKNIGSEQSSAERVRRYRERKALQSNGESLQLPEPVTTDIDIEIDTEIEVEEEGEKPEQSSPKPVSHMRGEYGYVKLTDKEFENLIAKHGKDKVQYYINYLDESAKISGNKNKWKDWNLVIQKAIREGWGKYNAQRNYDSDDGGTL